MISDTLYWREPLWLIAIIVPWLFILISYYKQKKIWQKMADPHLLPWLQSSSKSTQQSTRQRLSQFLLALSWVLFCIALAGPRTPQWIPPSLQADDSAVIMLIDYSSSMQAVDNQSNRIAQAQAIVTHWLNDHHDIKQSSQLNSTLKIGLIIYAGHSHTLLIPTRDNALLKHFIAQLPQFRPPTAGNNLSASLQTASELLKNTQGKGYIVLLSDGDFGQKAAAAAKKSAAQLTSEDSIHLSVIGVGQDEAVRIPLADGQSLTENGKVVVSRRQTAWLKQLAESAGGQYYHAEFALQQDLAHILDLPKARIDTQFKHQVLWHEWFFIPLISAMLLSLLALQIYGRSSYTLAAAAMLSLLAGCNNTNNSAASDQRQQFFQGVACYQNKDYLCAQQLFSRLAWSAEDKEIKRRAVFNLANTHFKSGNYEQASILFQDAERLGVSQSKTRINQQFADSLAAAVKHRLEAIAKTRQRAEWRSSAHKLPEGFEDRLAEGLYLPQLSRTKILYTGLPEEQQKLLIAQGIKYNQSERKAKPLDTPFWVLSDQKTLPQQTSGLFNSLMPIEKGLHYVPDEPVQVQGFRSW